MRLYYKAVASDGKVFRGFLEAKEPKEAAIYIRQRDLIPILIQIDEGKGITSLFKRGQHVGSKEIVFFTRQLASMLTAGLTLMQALAIIKNEVKNPYMGKIIQGVVDNIEEGKAFYVAIAQYPNVFSDIYIMIVKAAEESGLLDKILLRLAEDLEKREILKSKIKSAMFYPVIVLVVMVIIVIVMMIFFVPQITQFYSNFPDAELPFTTKVVIGISNIMANLWPIVLAGIAALIYVFKRWHATETGKYMVDRFLLKVPILGKLISQSIIAEFSRTFGLLIGTGSLVIDSLQKSADIVGNKLYRTAIHGVSAKVTKGISIGTAMENSPLFPPVLVEMVKIGEQTGKLDESLQRVSEFYEREVDQSIKLLTTAMEPLIIIVLAIMVGFLLFSILTPLYNVLNLIG